MSELVLVLVSVLVPASVSMFVFVLVLVSVSMSMLVLVFWLVLLRAPPPQPPYRPKGGVIGILVVGADGASLDDSVCAFCNAFWGVVSSATTGHLTATDCCG